MMPFAVSQLLEGRDPLICVGHNASVRDALTMMIERDFSQLPVVDDNGDLLGIVSSEVLARTYYHLEGTNILTLTVDQCRIPAETIPPEYDLIQALDRLSRVYSVVVAEGREDHKKPIGILTYFDTTHFFREYSQGLMLFQDIELMLRDYIVSAFPNEREMTAALFHAFGASRRDGTQPAKQYENMSLHEHVQFITTEENWPNFRGVFEPKHVFYGLMNPVIKARDQFAHFRGQLSNVQMDAMNLAFTWLKNCAGDSFHKAKLEIVDMSEPAASQWQAPEPESSTGSATEPTTSPRRRGKYEPLGDWLRKRSPLEKEIRVRLEDIEKLIDGPLPPFASHRSWWANDHYTRSQSLAWLRAGWQVKAVDFSAGEVTFIRDSDASTAEGEGIM